MANETDYEEVTETVDEEVNEGKHWNAFGREISVTKVVKSKKDNAEGSEDKPKKRGKLKKAAKIGGAVLGGLALFGLGAAVGGSWNVDDEMIQSTDCDPSEEIVTVTEYEVNS